jgi:hypothetical protein
MKLKQDAYVHNVTKTTHGQFDKSSLQEQDVNKEVIQVFL